MQTPTRQQLLTALKNLVNCIECDNTDEPEDERTWYCTGGINDAVTTAQDLLGKARP